MSAGTPLGEFLRARRARLTPTGSGLDTGGVRRVPGLRREEVAERAGIGWRYYARLEQGRSRNPSPSVIAALGRALELDADALGHLRALCEGGFPPSRALSFSARPAAKTVRPGIADLVARWREQPMVVVGRHRDVLVANRAATLVNPSFQRGRNLLRDVFLEPSAREVYLDWEEIAAGAIAGVRATAGDGSDDDRFAWLIRELSSASGDFRRMWARHEVTHRTHGAKRYRSPSAGELTLDYEALAVTGSPGQTMFVFSAEPGSPDEVKLRRLTRARG